MRAQHFCATLLLAIGPLGCGGPGADGNLSYGENARRAYNHAMEAFDGRDWVNADLRFQEVVRRFVYSRYGALAELRIADCSFEQAHYSEAIRAYRAFIRQRPTHADVPYANFRVALAYYKQIPDDFFLSPPPEERDLSQARTALRVLRRFLRNYDDTEWAEEVRHMETRTVNLLGRHELYVAGFYLSRDRPGAAILRIEHLVSTYRDSGLVAEALVLLGRTYLRQRDEAHAAWAFQELLRSQPESPFAVQAERYIAEFPRLAQAGIAVRPENYRPVEPEYDNASLDEILPEEESAPLPTSGPPGGMGAGAGAMPPM